MNNNINRNNMDQVSGIFNSLSNLEPLLENLHQVGIEEEDINILMTDQTKNYYAANSNGNDNEFSKNALGNNNKMPEGLSTGAVSGGLLGALIGGLTLIGSLVVPGAGLLAAGPIVGALTGGATGAVAGGLIGALTGMGIPDDKAQEYNKALNEKNSNNVLVVVNLPSERAQEIRSVFERYSGQKVKVN